MWNRLTSIALGFVLTVVAIFSVSKISTAVRSLPTDGGIEYRQDLQILLATKASLENERVLDKKDDRICVSATPRTLYCALANSMIENIGHYEHTGNVMVAVRQTINTHFSDRWTAHPIMDFNNHDDTTREDVYFVIDETINALTDRNSLSGK
jgi:hypothetical protein